MESDDNTSPWLVSPDDVLLGIFAYLSPRDVVTGVRGVCKQWRRLSLHPEVWQCMRLEVSRLEAEVALMVLEAGPRLLALDVNLDDVTADAKLLECLMGSACRAPRLVLRAVSSEQVCVAMVLLERLERAVRSLTLLLTCRATLTWTQLQYVKALPLQELCLPKFGSVRLDKTTRRVSSKDFLDYWDQPAPTRVLDVSAVMVPPLKKALVASVADSVRVVRLGGHHYSAAVAALADCEQLQEAQVPAVTQVAMLTACNQLTALSLWMDGDSSSHVDGLNSFLVRSAARLRRLEFHFSKATFKVNVVVVRDLLSSLASTGIAALEELQLHATPSMHPADALLDASLLRGLPRLHTLGLTGRLPSPDSDSMAALQPWVVPRLRVLELGAGHTQPHHPSGLCPAPGLLHLLEVNPRLHVLGVALRVCAEDMHSVCCHVHKALPQPVPVPVLGLMAHRASAPCPTCRSLAPRGVRWLCRRVRLESGPCRRCKAHLQPKPKRPAHSSKGG